MIITILLIMLGVHSAPLLNCGQDTGLFHPYELKVRSFLIENDIKFCTQATFKGLLKNTKHMKLDFYLTDLDIAIEVDEAHHFPSGNSTTNTDQIFRDSKLNNYFNNNSYCLVRIHWEDIYTSVPKILLDSFVTCLNTSKPDLSSLRFSSDRYRLFINTIWKWNTLPNYMYIMHPPIPSPIEASNPKTDLLGVSIGLGIVTGILIIANLITLVYCLNARKLLQDYQFSLKPYNADAEEMRPINSSEP